MSEQSRAPLPIDAHLPAICAAVREHGCLVLRAETGAGKTTRVPPALLAAGVGGKLVLVEPRRIAAKAAAERIAAEQGARVGEAVGFRVRFERRESSATGLLVMTDGMLLAALQADPYLEGIGAIVFDEAHERGLAADLALSLAAKVRREVRPELAIVVMSATIDAEPFASFLGAAVLDVPGRSHPVEIERLERPDERPLASRVASGIRRYLGELEGDLLAFLPGRGEIAGTARLLEDLRGVEVLELHGDLPLAEQSRALRRGPRRRVVLATNVAETSLTVEGIEAVVDSTLVRQARHDSARDLPRLDLVGASRAALAQRAGRAGRERPGRCLQLLTETDFTARSESELPEIARLDPAPSLLELLAWGEPDPLQFSWLEAPPRAALERAWAVLESLGAVTGAGLTRLGRALAAMPLPPRLGVLAATAWQLGHGRDGARAAALLEERDLRRPEERPATARCDLVDRLELLERSRRSPRAERILAVAHQIERACGSALGAEGAIAAPREEALARAALAAWPERLGRRRGSRSYRLASGRGALLGPGSVLADPELLVAVDLLDRGTDASIRLATTIELEWLPLERISTADRVEVDPGTGRVVGRRETSLGQLVLEASEIPVDAAAASEALAAVAAQRLDQVAPFDDPAFEALLARLEALAGASPELGVPRIDDARLVELLPALRAGRRSLGELQAAAWGPALLGTLPREIRLALDRDAPETLEVPSGSRVRLEWRRGAPPVLAVRIQELFGLAATPRLAGGRIPLLLHLLAPNGRPQQVTADLASFWREVYPAVRRELRGRYPKHAWPADPLTAAPERRPRRPLRG